MALFADIFRPFWQPGLNDVSGATIKDLAGWISDEEYQIYQPISATDFSLQVYDIDPFNRALATEITRIGIAMLETLHGVQSSGAQASIAWALIQRYYAAFFASHVLMRMMGRGCGSIGREQCASLTKVCKLWGTAPCGNFSSGLYRFEFDHLSSSFLGTSLTGSPHEAFWAIFDARIKVIADDLLSKGSVATMDDRSKQLASDKLTQLRNNLSHFKHVRQSAWLTNIRNGINYDHKWSTWWPYSDQPKYYSKLKSLSGSWRNAAAAIELDSFRDEDMLRFQATCNFILSICRENMLDMSERCSSGISFFGFGALAYMNQTKLLRAKQSPA
jgi:hypothetical protein